MVRILTFFSLLESIIWVQNLSLHSVSAFFLDLNSCFSGKTSLLSVFATGAFPNEFVPALFQSYVADLELDGRQVEIALWDTVHLEDYDRLRPLSYSNSHVILICYAIDTPESLTSVLERASPIPRPQPLHISRLILRPGSGSLRLVISPLRRLYSSLAARKIFVITTKSSSGLGERANYSCHPSRYEANKLLFHSDSVLIQSPFLHHISYFPFVSFE